MSNDNRVDDAEPQAPSNAPVTDVAGKPVNVVERDLQHPRSDAEAVDLVVTPTSTRAKEQDAEELQRKIAEIERKVADGN